MLVDHQHFLFLRGVLFSKDTYCEKEELNKLDGGGVMGVPPKHIVSAIAFVRNDDNELLLVKSPRRGWELPGGQVEEGESIKAAAIRETKEESGIDIEIVKFCGIFQNVKHSICSTLFIGKVVGGQLTKSPESLEVGYFPIEKALEMVTWKHFKKRIQYCLNEEVHPFFVEV
ncbi:Putative MutT/NUDIX-like protein [Mycobacteroides abscessus subsp. abscessus]|nr:Putative MutT/NUDIX-like protein [Mycobacteroides abscessus subsp. abscessus]